MRVAVAGVGNLGAPLVAELAARRHAVLAVDLAMGFARDVGEDVQSALCDVRDFAELTALLRAFRPDVVVNATGVSETAIRRRPSMAIEVHVAGAESLARAATASGARCIALLGCASVYGAKLADGPDESVQMAPVGLYAGSKGAAEVVSGSVAADCGTQHVVLRLVPLFGGTSHPIGTLGRAVADGVRDAVAGKVVELPLPAEGGVELLHVDDAARTLATLLSDWSRLPGTVNVGAGRLWTAAEVTAAFGSAVPSAAVSWLPTTDGLRHPLDVARLRTLVGPEIARPLEAGLRALAGAGGT